MTRKFLSFILSFVFLSEQAVYAQPLAFSRPAGLMPAAVERFRPVHMRCLEYYPDAGDFAVFLDKGSSPTGDPQAHIPQLMRYFLAGVSLPDSALWVNLRPDSPDKMLDAKLEGTELGRVLLAADVQLKKDTALLTSPLTEAGRDYWTRLYAKAEELFGGALPAIPTMARPWIVPGEIIVGESTSGAYVYKAMLKVKIEREKLGHDSDPRLLQLNEFAAGLLERSVAPRLTVMVNSTRRYAEFRQAFYSLVLAQWFKRTFRDKPGAYSAMIERGDLTAARSPAAWSKEEFFSAYKKSFDRGEYSLSKTVASGQGQTVRTYVSGGILPVAAAEQRLTLPEKGFLGPNLRGFKVALNGAIAGLGERAREPLSGFIGLFRDDEIVEPTPADLIRNFEWWCKQALKIEFVEKPSLDEARRILARWKESLPMGSSPLNASFAMKAGCTFLLGNLVLGIMVVPVVSDLFHKKDFFDPAYLVQYGEDLYEQFMQLDDNVFAAAAVAPLSEVPNPDNPLYRLDPAYYYWEHNDLKHNPTFTRQESEAARGMQYVNTSPAKEALARLTEATRLDSYGDTSDLDYARVQAAISLHRLGDPRGADALIDITRDGDSYSFGAKYAAVKEMGTIKNDPRVVDALLALNGKYAGSEYAKLIQVYSAAALQQLGDERGTALLMEFATDDGAGTGYEAIRALGDGPADPRVISTLVTILDDKPSWRNQGSNAYEQVYAAISLHKLGDPRGTEALLRLPEEVGSYEDIARNDALKALGDIQGDDRVKETLFRVMDKNTGHGTESCELSQAYAAASLQKLGDYRGTQKLMQLADQASMYSLGARYISLQALGEAPNNQEVKEFLFRAQNRDFADFDGYEGEVAQVFAAASLQKQGDSRGTGKLMELAQLPSSYKMPVRIEAIKALGDAKGDPRVEAALLQVINNPPADYVNGLTPAYAAASLARIGSPYAEEKLIYLTRHMVSTPGFGAESAIAATGIAAAGAAYYASRRKAPAARISTADKDGGNKAEEVGGIDLTTMGTSTRVRKLLASRMPVRSVRDPDWIRVKALAASGIVLYEEFKTRIARGKTAGAGGQDAIDDCAQCLLGCLRAEEETGVETGNRMKELLAELM